jgi:SAM-dependent methyltransferase
LSVVPQSAKKRMSANVARGDDTAVESPEKIRRDREREAREQIAHGMWALAASRALNSGRLIAAPVAKRLARLSRMPSGPSGAPRDRARILDLGGAGTAAWAWHVALAYPHCKVYTVQTKRDRAAANCNIRGPDNCRYVSVNRLTKLPFKDGQFDLISARHLHALLKCSSEMGEDEYDAVLRECLRILKPGGYLDFEVLDSDILNCGLASLAHAKSVEFGLSLKMRGYDSHPTKSFIPRLRAAGFGNVRRAWVFLPMGSPPPAPAHVARNSVTGSIRPLELEAMVMGSTDAVAAITGIVGAREWEGWMLRHQLEIGVAEGNLLEGVGAIIEEGRRCGAGWRQLRGWARKPLRK